MTSRESRTVAEESSVGLDPGARTAAVLHQVAIDHLRAARSLDAQLCCAQALEIDPHYPDSLHLMGVLSLQAGQLDLAVEWMARAIRQDPRPEFLSNLGMVLRRLERSQDAFKVFESAIRLKPDDAELWKNLGDALVDLKRPADAILGYQHALRLDTRHWEAAHRCAILLDQLGRQVEALAHLNLCEELRPNQVPTLRRRAAVLHNLKRFEAALADNLRAYELGSTDAETCNDIGASLAGLRRDSDALPWFERAIGLRPDFIVALINKTGVLNQAHRFEEAAAIYRQVQALDPGNAEAAWDLALLDLLTGNFEAGWKGREARWRARPVDYPKFAQPMWLGKQAVAGKTVVIHTDEGLGDTIQFVRYAPMLAERGARVVLVVQKPLCALLSGLAGVSQCLPASAEALPDFDFHCPTSSLPLAFGTRLDTIPATTSYLPPIDAARVKAWEDRLGTGTGLRVGLVWSGNPEHKDDQNRSIPLRLLAPLLDLDATFVSLQKNPRPADAALLRERTDIVDLTAQLTDFVETAALVSCLDIVVTVDTSVAHLAAALGRPTWIMLPYMPDYRWLLDRDDSPWYPTARLFRQDATRDWSGVVDRVRAALSNLVLCRRLPAGEARSVAAESNDGLDPGGLSAAALYRAAVEELRAGRAAEAQRRCARALEIDAGHAESLHLMGVLSLRAGNTDLAIEWIARAIGQDPKAEFLSDLGIALREAGRAEEALKAFDRAVQLNPNDAAVWKDLGNALVELKRPADAVLSYQHALGLDPRQWDTARRCATTLEQLGRLEEELACLNRCDEIRPNDVRTLRARAGTLYRLGRFDEALADNLRVHALDPADGDACNDVGASLAGLRRDDEALPWFIQALALRIPELRDIALNQIDAVEERLAAVGRARALGPANADTCNNIGDSLQRLGREEASLRWFDLAFVLRPDSVISLNGKAVSLTRLHRLDEAAAAYARMKSIEPDNARADFGLAHLHLMRGDFETGWALREARWRLPHLRIVAAKFSQPAWLGKESVEGKTILIYADEGMGDVIQFARYLPLLAERGARVILAVHGALCPLLSGLPGLSQCLSRLTGPLPAFDAYCPIMSLPLAFGTRLDTIPAKTPYLPPPPRSRVESWEVRLGTRDRLRVGLVWSGNPGHRDDHNRSIPLQALTRLLDVDATFISLQKDPRPADAAVLRQRPDIIDLTVDLTDFVETAALIACLDLVITVDTSVAHLAGALGSQTWLLLPYLPDFRWLLDRDDSPWYPTMRLFRQDARRDYAPVLEQVRNELIGRVAAFVPERAAREADTQPADRHQAAPASLDRASQLGPNDVGHLKRRAKALIDLGRPADALADLQLVVEADPSDWDAACRCGVLLRGQGRLDDALALFDRCNALQPNHALTLYLRAGALRERAVELRDLDKVEEALADYQRSFALDPTNIDACNGIGAALLSLGRSEEALPWFDRALETRPDFVEALNNKASTLTKLHRFDEAFAIYDHLKADGRNNDITDWNAALLRLLTGDFEAGWAGRESRWKARAVGAHPAFIQPRWTGDQSIGGKTILVHADEGLGDTIQFARYVPMLAALGASVVLAVEDPLVPLLAALPGLTHCVPKSATSSLPPFDLHCPICSLPLAFATRLHTIPAPDYLPPPAVERVKAWQERLGAHNRLRVGLVWSGNPAHVDDYNRSIPLQLLTRLLDVDATFVSLQKDPRPADAAILRERTDIVDVSADLTDFVETAALIACLDLVITVDTSVAHLAGTLGCPTWVLLPYAPDWRWLLDRDDSPWYPTVRLFRQDATRDYAPALQRVQAELRARATAFGHEDPARESTWRRPVVNAAAALCTTGYAHLHAGRHAEARACARQALAIDEDCAAALNLEGLVCFHAGEFDHAVEWFARAVRQSPEAEYLKGLGAALQRLGRQDEALKAFDKAVQLAPENAELWRNLGNALLELDRREDAVLSFQHALKLDPQFWDAAYKAGFLLRQLGRFEEALACFDVCDRLQPDHAATLQLRGLSLRGLGRHDDAHADILRAHALEPANSDFCNSLGLVLQSLSRSDEALLWFDRALALQPDFMPAFVNKAVLLAELHRFDEAIACYRKARTVDPDHAQAGWNLGLLQMLTGDFEAGWAGRELRWKAKAIPAYPDFAQPQWRGNEDVRGKTVVVYADEGLGDAIQFARYVAMLAERGARVLLVVAEPMQRLLSDLAGVSLCLPKSVRGNLPPFDLHCPMSSLPLAFGTRLDTIPAAISYLPAPPADRVRAFERRLGTHDRLRVGLVWSGNPVHRNDRNRSIALAALARILDVDATFVSLQKDLRERDAETLRARTDIVDLTAELADLADTAALIACLDLVIAVDTSVAHLSAALGCPTWILLPYSPDYRWLLDREDSPWYPTARLFRQDAGRDYAPVLDRVRTELQARAAAFRGEKP